MNKVRNRVVVGNKRCTLASAGVSHMWALCMTTFWFCLFICLFYVIKSTAASLLHRTMHMHHYSLSKHPVPRYLLYSEAIFSLMHTTAEGQIKHHTNSAIFIWFTPRPRWHESTYSQLLSNNITLELLFLSIDASSFAHQKANFSHHAPSALQCRGARLTLSSAGDFSGSLTPLSAHAGPLQMSRSCPLRQETVSCSFLIKHLFQRPQAVEECFHVFRVLLLPARPWSAFS